MRWQNFLYSLMGGMQRLFMGRNGFDQLTLAVIVAGFVLRILARFVWIPGYGVLYYALWFYSLFRMFSRNIPQRQKENTWFLNKLRQISSFFHKGQASYRKPTSWQQPSYYTYLKCPQCGQQLRVPTGKGMVNITCPKCGERITKKV